ncbi:MAG: NAD-dependent epimerase/dehydratase family protein [Alphaproteobacteria bacterium]|nr:NAD-dependent epimerase/dehydratase family protein [Alphaproteobacteria bacterium]
MVNENTPYSLSGKRIWVAGHRGMVGSAICRQLEQENCEILTAGREIIDLRDQQAVSKWMTAQKPDAVFLAAATVGGIYANDTRPAEFLYDNLVIETNIIHAAKLNDVEKLMFLGSACIYPREAKQPMAEDALLTSPLEPTNEWYAIAKIAGIKMCQAYRRQYGCDYISAMPNNLYGPGDNFDLKSSHVVPALIRKFHEAKLKGSPTVEIWGTGNPVREFVFVDDCASALIYLMKNYSDEDHVNIGSGAEISIGGLANAVSKTVGFSGSLIFNTDFPDGAPRKLLDCTKITHLGWKAEIGLKQGLELAYQSFIETVKTSHSRASSSSYC